MSKTKCKNFLQTMGGIRPKSGGRIIRGKVYNQYPKIKIRTREFDLPENNLIIPQIKIKT
jgi:hypothetical protein